MYVLAVNSGSSSLKFKLVEVAGTDGSGQSRAMTELCSGQVEEIGKRATLTVRVNGADTVTKHHEISTHAKAAAWMLEHVRSPEAPEGRVRIDAVGHRVVHGGHAFHGPVRIDDDVEREIEALSELAPLHNPACLEGIRGVRNTLGGDLPMVAVFDTAFHRTMPDWASRYAIPRDLAERYHIRRYGFHGIAHASVASAFAAWMRTSRERLRMITVHLGNGCSMAAVKDGRSIDTSMGFTPLEGLVMGTRSGDIDAGVVAYLARKERVALERVEEWLNHGSGLLGLSGISRDMRQVLSAAEEGRHPDAMRAVDLFCYRAKKYLGAYLAALGGAEAIIFSGGIGEHAPAIRARICEGMQWCGLVLDRGRNEAVTRVPDGEAASIGEPHSTLPAFVMHVDEESWIAGETVRCLEDG